MVSKHALCQGAKSTALVGCGEPRPVATMCLDGCELRSRAERQSVAIDWKIVVHVFPPSVRQCRVNSLSAFVTSQAGLRGAQPVAATTQKTQNARTTKRATSGTVTRFKLQSPYNQIILRTIFFYTQSRPARREIFFGPLPPGVGLRTRKPTASLRHGPLPSFSTRATEETLLWVL